MPDYVSANHFYAGGDCANHEDAQKAEPQQPGRRRGQANAIALQGLNAAHQKAGRDPHREGVSAAGRGRARHLRIPRIAQQLISDAAAKILDFPKLLLLH